MTGIQIDWPQPSHAGRITVAKSPDGSRRAVSTISLPAGAHLADFGRIQPIATPDFSTLQIGPTQHIELKSDLVFCNHSCRPTVEFDTKTKTVRVARDRPLQEGDDITFFYPSTEWSMDRPFLCACGASGEEGNGYQCLGEIQGAKQMDRAVLEKYWLNRHIAELLSSKGQ